MNQNELSFTYAANISTPGRADIIRMFIDAGDNCLKGKKSDGTYFTIRTTPNEWQDSVIDIRLYAALPVLPTIGDRYLIDHADPTHPDIIVEAYVDDHGNITWDEILPSLMMTVWNDDNDTIYTYMGAMTGYVDAFSGTVSHTEMTAAFDALSWQGFVKTIETVATLPAAGAIGDRYLVVDDGNKIYERLTVGASWRTISPITGMMLSTTDEAPNTWRVYSAGNGWIQVVRDMIICPAAFTQPVIQVWGDSTVMPALPSSLDRYLIGIGDPGGMDGYIAEYRIKLASGLPGWEWNAPTDGKTVWDSNTSTMLTYSTSDFQWLDRTASSYLALAGGQILHGGFSIDTPGSMLMDPQTLSLLSYMINLKGVESAFNNTITDMAIKTVVFAMGNGNTFNNQQPADTMSGGFAFGNMNFIKGSDKCTVFGNNVNINLGGETETAFVFGRQNATLDQVHPDVNLPGTYLGQKEFISPEGGFGREVLCLDGNDLHQGELVMCPPISISMDALSYFSNVYILGANTTNTSMGILYGVYTAATFTLDLYSDAIHTIAVAQCVGAVGGGTYPITEVAGSGITGQLDLVGAAIVNETPVFDYCIEGVCIASLTLKESTIGVVYDTLTKSPGDKFQMICSGRAKVLLKDATPARKGQYAGFSDTTGRITPSDSYISGMLGITIGVIVESNLGGIDQMVWVELYKCY
jgi:hypothetical protein